MRTTSPTETWIRWHAGYDTHRRRTLITNSADVGGSVSELDRYEYSFDAVGNRLTAGVSGSSQIADSVVFDYDDLHRLTSAACRRYTRAGGVASRVTATATGW